MNAVLNIPIKKSHINTYDFTAITKINKSKYVFAPENRIFQAQNTEEEIYC